MEINAFFFSNSDLDDLEPKLMDDDFSKFTFSYRDIFVDDFFRIGFRRRVQ